jgi:hypothetical protein|tara:strand:+ start:423 stop:857 length:435 start_codon:yes stop_codon:yes gene_type:complete
VKGFLFIFGSMKICYLIAFALLVVSCEKTKFPSEYSKQLIGTWELEWRAVDAPGPLLTPEDLGETKKYQFKDNARYIKTINGKRVVRGDYHIISEVQGELIAIFMQYEEFEQINLIFNDEDGAMDIYFRKENKNSDHERYQRID